MTPTARTLKLLKEQGWVGDVVERRNQFIARDYGGIGDVLVIRQGVPLLVQATTDHDAPRRVTKAITERGEWLTEWLKNDGLFHVWGWQEVEVRTRKGKAKLKWQPRVRVVRLVDGKLVTDPIERKKPNRRLFR